jgi:signal peptidase I
MAWGWRRAAPRAERQGLLAGAWETLKTVFWALLIAGLFRTLLFQPFFIPSGSMKDTLLIGDFLFVNKWAYGYSYASCPSVRIAAIGLDVGADDVCGWAQGKGRLWGSGPERGDVVVFRHPVTGQDFIKRLIGLPGDRVQVRAGVLHLNDAPVALEPDGTFLDEDAPGGPREAARYQETLPGGVTHDVLDLGATQLDDTGVFTVPEGHFFFMGDNRDNSTDSRVPQAARGVGMVPFEDLVGRADRVIFSSAGRSMLFFWTWRLDRFFHPIT